MNRVLLLFFIIFCRGSSAQDFKIGIIADCQYCDCDYSEVWNNDYRKAPQRLKVAVDNFNSSNVEMVFHLGDFIDRDFDSYNKVLSIIDKLNIPFYFVLGNHEFSVVDSLKKSILNTLNLTVSYYTVQKNDWLFIVLDGTEVSPYHSSELKHVEYANDQMSYYEKLGRSQAKPWNGAIGKKQMGWLEDQLRIADKENLKVIVVAHFPVLPKAALNLWNDEEVIQILDNHNCVKAYFNGHNHLGNYVQNNDIHYVTFQAMVRSQNETAYAIVEISDSVINIYGKGREPNRTLWVK